MSLRDAVDAAAVTSIAAEVFTAMIDGQSGLLTSWQGGPATVANPLHAWVDLHTEPASRVQLTTEVVVADDLARAFLRLEPNAAVADADVQDAFGEIANICSGNIKALLPEHVGLTLPEVSRKPPSGAGAARFEEVLLAWRGRPIIVSLWTI
jgi:chemotaxis protein CheX